MSEKILQAVSLAIQANVPTLLWGEPGIGKTRVVEALGKVLGMDPVVTLIASIHDPTDFSGLPFFDRERGLAVYAAPDFVSPLIEAEKGILFIDEFNTAPPAVEVACWRIILEGVVGNIALPPEVRRVAAANPPEIAVNGRELSLPMSNRFVHIDFDAMETRYYIQGMVQGFKLPEIPALPTDWRERHLGEARGLVAAFLTARPNLLRAVPKNPPYRGWPSPRTWYDFTAPLLAACKAVSADRDVEMLLVQGCVGEAAAMEFLTWKDNLDLPDPHVYLRKPNTPLPKRDDQVLAVLVGVVNVAKEELSPETWGAAWQVLARVGESKPDLAAMPATILLDTGKQYDKEYNTPAFRRAISRIATVYRYLAEESGRGRGTDG